MNKPISVAAITAIILLSACSTMSFIPTEGGAAKFNLATVEYVENKAEIQKAELIDGLSANMVVLLDSLLVPERTELAELSQHLDSLELMMLAFSSRIDSSEFKSEAKLAGMSKELNTVKANASNTRTVLRRINDDIDDLPVKALETFNEAIEAYINKQEETD